MPHAFTTLFPFFQVFLTTKFIFPRQTAFRPKTGIQTSPAGGTKRFTPLKSVPNRQTRRFGHVCRGTVPASVVFPAAGTAAFARTRQTSPGTRLKPRQTLLSVMKRHCPDAKAFSPGQTRDLSDPRQASAGSRKRHQPFRTSNARPQRPRRQAPVGRQSGNMPAFCLFTRHLPNISFRRLMPVVSF